MKVLLNRQRRRSTKSSKNSFTTCNATPVIQDKPQATQRNYAPLLKSIGNKKWPTQNLNTASSR